MDTFKCKAEWRHGPGHQSLTRCGRTDPHTIDDDHWVTEVVAEWTGPDTFYGERYW